MAKINIHYWERGSGKSSDCIEDCLRTNGIMLTYSDFIYNLAKERGVEVYKDVKSIRGLHNKRLYIDEINLINQSDLNSLYHVYNGASFDYIDVYDSFESNRSKNMLNYALFPSFINGDLNFVGSDIERTLYASFKQVVKDALITYRKSFANFILGEEW